MEEVLTDRALSESLDEDIGKTLREIQARPENQPEPEEPAKAETPAPEKEAKEDKPRAPDGKFVKDTKSAAPAKADTPQTPIAAPEQEAAEPPLKFGKVEVDLTRPPSSWKPQAKVAWQALPDEVRKEIYRRETDFSNTVLNGPLKESADFGKSVRAVIEPYRGMIEAEGGTPERAVADLMKTAALFRTGNQQQKKAALYQIDQQFNCGFREEFQNLVQSEVAKITGGQPQVGQPGAQPAVIQDPRYEALQNQFTQIKTALQRQEQERMDQARFATDSAVQEFYAAKDDKGQPKYPFVDNLIDDMVLMMPDIRKQNPAANHAQVLQMAYDASAWANPETRAVLIQQQQAQVQAPAEALRKAGQARAATAGHIPKRGGLPASAPETNLRLGTPESDASIKETLRQLTNA